MDLAFELAREAARAGEVPVGAVITDAGGGRVIGRGRNSPVSASDPTAHAEIVALRDACAAAGNYRLPGAWLFVTLEPCAMCAGAISAARIGRVIFAARDPKGGALLHGPHLFSQPTLHWRPEIAEDRARAPEAAALLRTFFAERRKK